MCRKSETEIDRRCKKHFHQTLLGCQGGDITIWKRLPTCPLSLMLKIINQCLHSTSFVLLKQHRGWLAVGQAHMAVCPGQSHAGLPTGHDKRTRAPCRPFITVHSCGNYQRFTAQYHRCQPRWHPAARFSTLHSNYRGSRRRVKLNKRAAQASQKYYSGTEMKGRESELSQAARR